MGDEVKLASQARTPIRGVQYARALHNTSEPAGSLRAGGPPSQARESGNTHQGDECCALALAAPDSRRRQIGWIETTGLCEHFDAGWIDPFA